MFRKRIILGAVLCALLSTGMLRAQGTTGTILGTVSDSTGAVIPGVAITARNVETGITRTVNTDEVGRYRAAQLGPGNYEISAESAGFQTMVRSGITLTVGREAVVDFTMQVGAVSERVTVTGEAPLIEATSSAVSSVVEGQTIRELPLNGRSFDQLALLQPGVFLARTASGGNPGFGGGSTWISISGTRPNQSVTLYDGTNINSLMSRAGAGVGGRMLGVDAIREFRLLTNNYNAEFGRSVGGVINVVTRSGTNDFHGSAFEFLRNSAMDARDFFNPTLVSGLPNDKPAFKRNQFGVSIGGPIARDRTFFFGVYEGLRDRLSTPVTSFVPNDRARLGLLPGSTTDIRVEAIKPFLALYPVANGPDVGQGIATLFHTNTSNTNENFEQIRIDHQFNENHSLFGRLTADRANLAFSNSHFPWNAFQSDSENTYLTLQYTTILSPTVLNTARFGYTRIGHSKDSARQPEILRYGSVYPRVGDFQIGGGLSAIGVGTATGDLRPLRNMFEYSDDMSVTMGSHSFKFGAVFERFRDFWFYDFLVTGNYAFNNLSDFLRNIPATYRGALPGADPRMHWRQSLFGFYAQDDYQVASNLTLNLGIRYEFITNPTNAINRPGLGTQFGIITDTLRDTKFSLTEHPFRDNPSLRNIAPRFGFAWDVFGDGKMALRGGFGMTYDQLVAQYYTFWANAPPLTNSVRLVTEAATVPNRYIVSFPNPLANLRSAPVLGTNEPTDYNTTGTPTVLQYNLNVQRELPGGWAVQIGYVGSHGYHLGMGRDANTPFPTILSDGQYFIPTGARSRNPNFGELGLRYFEANTWYNSLQLSIQKRLSGGFAVTTSYTWSRSVDDFSGVRNGDGLSGREGIQNPDCLICDRGLSDFHRGHVFSTNSSYELPFGPGRAMGGNLSGIPGAIIGGWDLAGILSLNSGLPRTAYVNFDRPGLRTVSSTLAVRPDLKPGSSNNPVEGNTAGCAGITSLAGHELQDPNLWYDPCAFSLQPAGYFGNVGRGTIIGPGITNFDFSLVKNNRWGEEGNVQFRAEFFNIFNHPNFGSPNTNIFSSAAGTAAATSGRITSTSTDNRRVQFGLKVTF